LLGIPEVSTVNEDGTARLVLTGEIDVSIAPAVVSHAEQLLAGRPHTVIVDLSAVTFLDSAGIGALVTLSNSASDAGIGSVRLVPGPRNVMRVLQIVGLTDVFDLPEEPGAR